MDYVPIKNVKYDVAEERAITKIKFSVKLLKGTTSHANPSYRILRWEIRESVLV